MLKKSTLLSVSIFFLLFIGLSDYGYGCHRGPDSHDGGGCGKVDGEGSNTFQVHLAGAFVFGRPTVTNGVLVVDLNEKRNNAFSRVGVHMSRPGDEDELVLEQMTWDGVFATCPVLVGLLEERQVEHVDSIFVGDDDWRISINTGEIRLKFPHMLLTDSVGDIDKVDLDLQLIGDLDLNSEEIDFPPLLGKPITIENLRFDIRGSTVRGIQPRERCGLNIMSFMDAGLVSPILTICAEGDPCP
jgi:hypothetical protein